MSCAASSDEPKNGSDLIDLCVLYLNGETYMLRISASCLGREVYHMISQQHQQLPRKGWQFALHYRDSQLILHQTLREQGIGGKAPTLSCTFVPGWWVSFILFVSHQMGNMIRNDHNPISGHQNEKIQKRGEGIKGLCFSPQPGSNRSTCCLVLSPWFTSSGWNTSIGGSDTDLSSCCNNHTVLAQFTTEPSAFDNWRCFQRWEHTRSETSKQS